MEGKTSTVLETTHVQCNLIPNIWEVQNGKLDDRQESF